MPDFGQLFIKTGGQAIEYNGKILVMSDEIAFEDGDHILVTIEKTHSEWKQGVGLCLFGFFEEQGDRFKDRIILWDNLHTKSVELILWKNTTKRKHSKRLPKNGILHVYNVWEIKSLTGHPCVHYWHHGAAMIVEEIENGRRYRCNDGHPDDNFDDIVFTIQKIS